jgi:hypothetical protein
VRVDESELRTASFLDERLGGQRREGVWVPLAHFLAADFSAGSHSRSADFIFHIGHCGSTLLSRLLDRAPDVLGLREPLVLRELAAEMRHLHAPLARLHAGQWQTLLGNSLQLWERGYSPAQRIVIKATSTCNNLIGPILALRPQARAVLLHLRLEPYLATMIKRPGGGLDAQNAAPGRLEYLHELLGETSIRLPDLQPAEILAMGWIAELARFHRLMADPAISDRLTMLDFEQLLADVPARLDAVRRHLRLPPPLDGAARDARHPAMNSYAKDPSHAYSPDDREHDLALARSHFAADIAMGLRWADALIERHSLLAPLRTHV